MTELKRWIVGPFSYGADGNTVDILEEAPGTIMGAVNVVCGVERTVAQELIRQRQIAAEAERLVAALPAEVTVVLSGLADRPRPGAKAAAREHFVSMLTEIHQLRKVIERTRPVRLVPSDGE